MDITAEHIQPYVSAHDADAITALWQQTVGQQWPLAADRLHFILSQTEPAHFVARVNGEVVGFVATFQSFRGHVKVGHLALLLVAPALQRQGIGTALHATALEYFKQAGLSSVQLGSISPRFWCGIPTDLPSALAFFRHLGWENSGTVYDLVRDISDSTLPVEIVARMQREGISIECASSENVTDVLAFEAKEFPNWLRHFEHYADLGDHRDLLVARDQRDKRVVGSLVMYSPLSHPERTDIIWQQLLGERVGAMGAVGVDEGERGRGIGIALVAYATEQLKQRGTQNCYIDWLVIPDFYGKLGYKEWRTYETSWREL